MQIQKFIKNTLINFFNKLINLLKKLIRVFLPLIGMGVLSEKKYFLLLFFFNPFLKFEFLNYNFIFRIKFFKKLQIQRKLNFVYIELALKKKLLKCLNNFNCVFFIKGKNLEGRQNKKFKKKLFFFKFLNLLKNLIVMNIIFFYHAFLLFILFFLVYFILFYFSLALDCSLISYEFKKEGLKFLLYFMKIYFISFYIHKLFEFMYIKRDKINFHKISELRKICFNQPLYIYSYKSFGLAFKKTSRRIQKKIK